MELLWYLCQKSIEHCMCGGFISGLLILPQDLDV